MTKKINLYLHTYSLRFHLHYKEDFNLFSFIEKAAKEQFDGVCISANDENYRHIGGTEDWRLPPIKEKLEQHDLFCDLDTSGTNAQHLAKKLRVAKAIGANKLRTYTRYEGATEDIVAQTIKDFKEIAPIAEELDIVVMLENHETFTGQDIAQILETVNHPYIAALYDYGNSQNVLEDPLACLEVMGPLAHSAHLKDHVMLKAEGSPYKQASTLGVPIGDGYLPLIEQTKNLLEFGCRNIVFENSYGYLAPVKPERMTEVAIKQLGEGSFRYAKDPKSYPEQFLFSENHSPDELVKLEDAMHTRTLAWLRAEFEKQGWL